MQDNEQGMMPGAMNPGMMPSPYGAPGVPVMPGMQGAPPRADMAGPPGVPPYHTPPYVLVPTSALQFIPGYGHQVMPPQGGGAGGFRGPYGSFPDVHDPQATGNGGGRSRYTRNNRPPSVGSSSPPRKAPDGVPPGEAPPSGPPQPTPINALADTFQGLSFGAMDDKPGDAASGSRAVRANGAAAGARKPKRPCVEELEEARLRTVYVSDLNKGITETELVRWFSTAGHVLECRICSDMNTTKRFAFVEFADQQGFENGLAMSGEKLGGAVIKVSPSKTPIVPINRDFMPRDDAELERCERTVYVNQIDRAVPSSAVEAMFENFCGAIEHVKMKLDKQHNTRIAFIEFKSNEAAKTALGLCGAQLGCSQIRVSPSKTPVRVHAV